MAVALPSSILNAHIITKSQQDANGTRAANYVSGSALPQHVTGLDTGDINAALARAHVEPSHAFLTTLTSTTVRKGIENACSQQ